MNIRFNIAVYIASLLLVFYPCWFTNIFIEDIDGVRRKWFLEDKIPHHNRSKVPRTHPNADKTLRIWARGQVLHRTASDAGRYELCYPVGAERLERSELKSIITWKVVPEHRECSTCRM